jgi:hypothetical protein
MRLNKQIITIKVIPLFVHAYFPLFVQNYIDINMGEEDIKYII